MRLSKTVRAAICLSALTFAALPLAAGASQPSPPRPAGRGRLPPVRPLSSMARLDLAVGLPLAIAKNSTASSKTSPTGKAPTTGAYLSSSQFAERFGPTQSDYDRLAAFFQANGFTVSGTHSKPHDLDVMGPVSPSKTPCTSGWRYGSIPPAADTSRRPRSLLDVDVAVLDIAGLDNYILPRPMDLKRRFALRTCADGNRLGTRRHVHRQRFPAAYAPRDAHRRRPNGGTLRARRLLSRGCCLQLPQAGLPPCLFPRFYWMVPMAPGGENIEVILDIVMAGYMAPEAASWSMSFAPNDVLNRMATDNFAKQLSCSGVQPHQFHYEQVSPR